MSARGDLLAYLASRDGVVAAVIDRIAWDFMDQGAQRPYFVLRGLKEPLVFHLGGLSSIRQDVFEVYTVASSPAERATAKAAIDLELRCLGATVMGSTRVRQIRREDDGPDMDYSLDAGSQTRVFEGRHEYRMWFWA